MRYRVTILSLLSLTLMFGGSVRATAECWGHPNSRGYEGDPWDSGPYCADSGGGCTDCLDWNPAPGVYWRYCVYDWSRPGDLYCYDGGYPWEYQM